VAAGSARDDTNGAHRNLFRSEEMSLVQLIIQFESAHEVVSELGHLGMVQFRDVRFYFPSLWGC